MNIACFSVAAMDFFPQQNLYCAGGNALNQSVHFPKLGHPSAFFGAVGQDSAGDTILRLLKAAGVDTTHSIQLPGETASNQIINDSAGERFGVEGAWNNGVYGTYHFDDETWQAIQSFDVWTTTCVDPHFEQILNHKKHHPEHQLCVDFLHLPDPKLLENSLEWTDIAFIGGTTEMRDALESLAKQNPSSLIVLTLGASGSIAFHQGNQYLQTAIPVEKVIDTTGCGDAFQAAFTASFFTHNHIEKALLAGAQNGAQTTQHYGAQPSFSNT